MDGWILVDDAVRRNTGREQEDAAGLTFNHPVCLADEFLAGWRFLADQPAMIELLQLPWLIRVGYPAPEEDLRNVLCLLMGNHLTAFPFESK